MPVPAGRCRSVMSCALDRFEVRDLVRRAAVQVGAARAQQRAAVGGRRPPAPRSPLPRCAVRDLDQPELDVIDGQRLRGFARRSAAARARPAPSAPASPVTVKSAPRRAIVTSSAASIWRRFASSGPHRLASARLSTGASVSVSVERRAVGSRPCSATEARRAPQRARAAAAASNRLADERRLLRFVQQRLPFPAMCAFASADNCRVGARASSARKRRRVDAQQRTRIGRHRLRRPQSALATRVAYSRCRLRRNSEMSLPVLSSLQTASCSVA